MSKFPTVEKNLKVYINAGFPILYIRTHEEEKADRYISDAAGRRGIIEWNGAKGLVDFVTKNSKYSVEQSLENALSSLNNVKELNRKLLVIKDAGGLLASKDVPGYPESNKITAILKEIARKIRNKTTDAVVIIVSPELHIPEDLEKLITVLELDYPGIKEIADIINRFTEELKISAVNQGLLDEMSTAFKGLTESEIKDILSLAVVSNKGELTRNALKLIFAQKQQMILKAGILEMIPQKEGIEDIGGLENLKDWLRKKAKVFKDINKAVEFGVAMPKGVLIAGVPGCGKSLSAKAAGKLFDVPLLRLDMGRLMGKYVGESEENMRKAIRLAEAISPCVLWVDEMEKAFAGIGSSGSGGEVTTRLFGAFLTWMQEKTSAAFVVATANDITKLPPELLRKGRFDEIFYVPLPNEEERRKIFEIHLNKRRDGDILRIDVGELVAATEGYSGADIEGVVSESVESAFVNGKDVLSTEDVLECIYNTHSLSEIMKEPLEEMAKLYEDRKFKKASR